MVSIAAEDSGSDLAIAAYDEFVAGEFAEAAGAAGVEAVGADADFGTHSKFAAVIEPRTGIDYDCGRIHFTLERHRAFVKVTGTYSLRLLTRFVDSEWLFLEDCITGELGEKLAFR